MDWTDRLVLGLYTAFMVGLFVLGGALLVGVKLPIGVVALATALSGVLALRSV